MSRLLVAVTTFAAAMHTLAAQDSAKALGEGFHTAGTRRHLAENHLWRLRRRLLRMGFQWPSNFDRAYTTQPARHAEFNINLAFVGGEDQRAALPRTARAAVWDSCVANYAGEPTIGRISGSSASQYIQEATAGFQVSPKLWIDGGIFLVAHGLRRVDHARQSRRTTRSLVGDFSPYYEAGVKLTWQATPSLAAQLVVVNGWQDISTTTHRLRQASASTTH